MIKPLQNGVAYVQSRLSPLVVFENNLADCLSDFSVIVTSYPSKSHQSKEVCVHLGSQFEGPSFTIEKSSQELEAAGYIPSAVARIKQ